MTYFTAAMVMVLAAQHPAAAIEPPPGLGSPVAEIASRVKWSPRDTELENLENIAPPPAVGGATPLSLAELKELAFQHNPVLAQSSARVRAAEGDYLQAGLYPNPVVGYQGQEVGIDGTAGQQGAALSQELVTAGKLRLGRAVVSHEIQQARFAWETQRRRLENDVESRYVDVLVAQELVTIYRQLLRVGEEGSHAAEQLFQAQEVGRADVLQASVETDSARLQLATAQNQAEAAWRRLAAVVGMPSLEPRPVAGSLEDRPLAVTWEASLARVLAESPELARAQAAVERARCELSRQWAGRVPNVTASTAVRYSSADEETLADVGVSLPLPVFDRNQGNICRAQAELVAAQREVERLQLALQERLAAAFQRYATGERQTSAYRDQILPRSRESLELVAGGYRQGEFDYLTLLTAQRTYFQANLQYIEALRQWRLAAIEIEGLLLGGVLE